MSVAVGVPPVEARQMNNPLRRVVVLLFSIAVAWMEPVAVDSRRVTPARMSGVPVSDCKRAVMVQSPITGR